MKNFFKAIFGRIKPVHTPRSLHPSLNQLEESTSNLTFICPGCGFHLQLASETLVEASNKSKPGPRGTLGHLRHARLLPLTTDQIAVPEGPLNMVPRPHHVILPPATDQITAFKEALNTLPYLPRTNPQPDTQSSPTKLSNRSQFKFPTRKWEHLTLPGHPVASVPNEYSNAPDEGACAIAFFIGSPDTANTQHSTM